MRAALLAALVGCSHGGAAARTVAPALPICLRAEATDHASGIQDFAFDADGDLVSQIEYDNTGKELARTTLTWSPTTIAVARTGGAFPFELRGTLGAHGELVDYGNADDRAHLTWAGTFAPVATPAAARFAFEQYYHVVADEPLAPLDTALRGVWPRMRAFVFTGTVTIHHEGHASPHEGDTIATYDRGHQISLALPDGIAIATTWSGDVPTSQTRAAAGTGTARDFTFARGHLAHIGGIDDVTFTYDAAGTLTHVHTGPHLDVDVARCPR